MIPPPPPPSERRRASIALAALTVGTALNPLNSSMIAVALLALQQDFGLGLVAVTWVITVFYIASIVGQPLMGRIIDAFGARRIFLAGMVVVAVAAVLAPLGGSFVLVCVARGLMAVGTSVAFPAALTLVAPLSVRGGIPTARLLARIQVTNIAGAALGPVLGGVLVTFAGWQSIFLVNVPLAAVAFAGVAALAPRDARREATTARGVIAALDPVGIVTFAVGMTAVVVVALDTADGILWWLLAVGLAALAVFVWWELRARPPFLDLRMLARNRPLRTVYLAYAVFSVLYYLAFFGLPQLLEERGGYSSAVVGLLLLPLAASTMVFAPIAARMLERWGVRAPLIWGSVVLIPAAALLGIGVVTTAPLWMVLMAAAIGIPYCVVSLAITQAMQRSAPPEAMGVVSGLMQSTRYVGAIAATVLLGQFLGAGVTAQSWATVAVVATAATVVHLVIVVIGTRPARPVPEG